MAIFDETKINPCKLCGSRAEGYRIEPDESGLLHLGWVKIECMGCSQSMKIESQDMCVSEGENDTGWDVIFRRLAAAEVEVVRRWNILNDKGS